MALPYRLAVLTHGDSRTLPATLASFRENVSPSPAEVFVYYDGEPDGLPDSTGVYVYGGTGQEGFCVATRKLWGLAAMGPGPQFVFWLEHDFEFTRRVDLRALATVLAENPQLAQVALMRDAVNETEKTAGGLVESRPGEFEQRVQVIDVPEPALAPLAFPWMEQQSYFTTNPSLMLRGFMRLHPFPDYPEFCEGRFGVDLREKGFTFSAAGWGEPWCRHIGDRDGFGY